MARIDVIEVALARAFRRITDHGTPPRLRAAMAHALFPGGARVRPRLALAVARACGGEGSIASHAAVAVEMIHCASLVHDDLPCFDDAPVRRGRPAVHAKFGESLAVLVGDGLIVAAFDELADGISRHPRLAPSIGVLAGAVGASGGLVAGQAWEDEPETELGRYHRAKTGALFEAAACMGAIAAGVDPAPWRALGSLFGEAYQLADDILDGMASASELGKPVGQDLAHSRPSALTTLGLEGSQDRLHRLRRRAPELVPACAQRIELQQWLDELMGRVLGHALRPPMQSFGASLPN
ncbi:MAG: polyprenyl synthetase family protein [Deltaproteobacteria bacterium]|nr:polyprenyl synthetase family protein [Nannocystaceae bacterium]